MVQHQVLEKQSGSMNSTNLMFRATVLGFLELLELLQDGAGENNAAYSAVRTQEVYESENNEIKKLN